MTLARACRAACWLVVSLALARAAPDRRWAAAALVPVAAAAAWAVVTRRESE